MRSEGQAEALKFGEEIFLVIDWGTGRREKEGAGIVRARYVATRGSSTFLCAFIFWFARVAQLLYGRGMPRPKAEVNSFAQSIMAKYWVAASRAPRYPMARCNSTFCRAFYNAKSMSSGMPRSYTSFASNHQPLVSLAAVPSSPHLPFVLLTPHTHAVRPEGS